ncbi:hypothetical protein GO755_32855 [Spirosoma sp. HMF4905]|uniref:Late embryogenesis abundant protein LEA-2 subgroup domain-containing protein n=1 Tax=Spirosoma arboris TaxID=2682092 RepID=A0A7K1SM35_9BACT|nr:LEA type 2 family protein [Spirosoma arboris]MVM34865.1 hypothetical protein [Spirosoma arboris]
MKKGFIILAIVVIIALYILNKVNTAKQLEFTVGLPKNVSLQGGALTFDLPLTSLNVASGEINIKAIDFDVLTNGKPLGKAILLQPVTIVANASTTFYAHVTIGYFDLITAANAVINLFKSGKVNLTLDGLVYAEGVQFPVKQSFDLDTKTLL